MLCDGKILIGRGEEPVWLLPSMANRSGGRGQAKVGVFLR